MTPFSDSIFPFHLPLSIAPVLPVLYTSSYRYYVTPGELASVRRSLIFLPLESVTLGNKQRCFDTTRSPRVQ